MNLPLFAVVGHPNKGKSSIVSTLASDDSVRIGREAGTTKHCRRYPMRLDGQELYALVDTPGFQRARRALAWMKQHETTSDRHGEIVRRFVEKHQRTGEFPDECELLTPILEGAGILYVVDGSVPFGEEYEAEMEILRWTGQPSMALINPIGRADYLEQWRAALSQYFKVVRVFNAVMAEFSKRLELLRAFGQLSEDWRGPLEKAVAALEKDRQRRRRIAARAIAESLAEMLRLKVEKALPEDADPAKLKPDLEEQYKDELRRLEKHARDRVEQAYDHYRIERQEDALELLEADLFSQRTWRVFGLSRAKLMAAGAASGAAAGAIVDAHVGGASLLAGTILGAGLGAFTGWWAADQLVKVKVLSFDLGGQRLVAGPTKNVNFPHVVFNRARCHHYLVATRNHALRTALQMNDAALEKLPDMSDADRRKLETLFNQYRKGKATSQSTEQLAETIEGIFENDDRPQWEKPVLQPGG